ncbi:MAG: hypothetical protein QOJ79_1987 [Actinomycetota bacterium]|jgi:O-antigen/teichoic acid export membrane protein|nr:hypothetical protein [Actinomycetota bacterium]
MARHSPSAEDPEAAGPSPVVASATRRAAGNAVISATAQVMGKVATLLWTLVAARELTPREFGHFTFVLATALLLSAVAEWGFDQVLIRRASARLTELPRLLGQTLVWEALVGVPVFVLGGAAVVLSDHGANVRLSSVLIMLSVLLDIGGSTCRSAAVCVQRQASTSAALVAQRLLTGVFAVAALTLGGGLIGVAAALLGGSVVGLGLHVNALRRIGVRPDLTGAGRASMHDTVRDTWLVGVSTLTLMALFRGDAVLLAQLKGDVAVAIYATAYKLLETVLFLAFAVRGAVFPLMSRAADRAEVARVYAGGCAAAFFAYLPFSAVMLVDAAPILRLLFGDRYGAAAAPSLRWLALTPLFYAVAYLGNSALQVVDQGRGMLGAALCAVVVNLGLNVVLIPAYGATGAGAVTTISYAVQAGLIVWWLRRSGVRAQLLRAGFEPLLAGLLTAGVLLLLPLSLLPEVVVAAVTYLAVWCAVVRVTAPHHLVLLGDVLRRRGLGPTRGSGPQREDVLADPTATTP